MDVSTDTDTRTCTCICAGFWEFYAADLKSWSKESVPKDQVGKRIKDNGSTKTIGHVRCFLDSRYISGQKMVPAFES